MQFHIQRTKTALSPALIQHAPHKTAPKQGNVFNQYYSILSLGVMGLYLGRWARTFRWNLRPIFSG